MRSQSAVLVARALIVAQIWATAEKAGVPSVRSRLGSQRRTIEASLHRPSSCGLDRRFWKEEYIRVAGVRRSHSFASGSNAEECADAFEDHVDWSRKTALVEEWLGERFDLL